MLKQCLLFPRGKEEDVLDDMITGIEEGLSTKDEEFDEVSMDPFLSSWKIKEDSEVSPRSRTSSLASCTSLFVATDSLLVAYLIIPFMEVDSSCS